MRGANRKLWILIVIDLFAHLMALSGFSALISSNTILGQLLIIYGGVVTISIKCSHMVSSDSTNYSSAATRRLSLAASSIYYFGGFCTMTSQIWFFIYTVNKSLAWLGIMGSFLMFIGELLRVVNILKVQQMNGSEDAKEE